ncbi:hypothetical protein RN001_014825 [Aquatica leii]|uniref:Major facilitator superfamily (MFS) profile domain-containing protein n=1 Tax=Aquatica leii TaxID=1421715 RepID=A0AAN7P2G5_9COLE|nr:hypothetical protein RN001_014825 [Aquatica leii]
MSFNLTVLLNLQTTMAYDDVIPMLGNFGRYQKRIYLLLCLPAILCAFHKLSNMFLQAKPYHRCQLPSELPNATYDLNLNILNASFPYDATTAKYSSCSMLDNGNEVPCDGYIFDYSKYKSSIVIEWSLVCNRAYLTAIGDSIFMLGVLLGSVIFGDLSDRLGRRIIFFSSLVIQVIFGILMAIAPEFWSYSIFRLMVGSTTSGVFLVAYVIAMEMVGPKDRLIAGVVCQMFFSLGYMLVAFFAYFINEWRYLQIALTLPGVLFFSYWWFIPESPRWLLTKGRIEEAKKIVRTAAKENNVKIPEDDLHMLLSPDVKSLDSAEKSATVLDIFKHRSILKRSLVIFFDWMVNSMTYYGLSWNTNNLGGNDYINFVISGAVEIPAYAFLLLTLNRWGRKYILCGCMVTAGVALLMTMTVPNDHYWAIVTLAMIGKLSITASYGTVYIFSTEQFPTVIRNAALGVGSMCARIGSISAPLINLTSEAWKPFPLIIFGILALVGGTASLVLPETLNQTLPATMADIEAFGTPLKNVVEDEQKLKISDDDEKIKY